MSKEDFKILSPREHVRMRAGMYVGSTSKEETERFVLGKWNKVTYVPALSKIIDEIVDNSLDEAIRTNFKHANKIDVSIKNNTIIVSDNGRGIPQDLIKDSITGEDVLRPVAAWTKTNAGTSFTDDRVTVGANGVGSACANFLSKTFKGETWQNGQKVTVFCKEGGLHIDVKLSQKAGSGTVVSFDPDFDLMETSSLNDYDTIPLIEERLTSLQLAFPDIKFTFNGKRVSAKSLKEYATLFTEGSVVSSTKDDLNMFFCASDDGFRSNSFINGVNTRLGGSYVDHIVNGVCDELVAMIKRKHKIEVGKATIKNGLTFVMFARNFRNPRFDSQTKERLTSPVGTIKEHYASADQRDFKWFATKLMGADDIIQPIIEAQLAKKLAADKRAATLAQKKAKKAKVAKHIPATSNEATLLLCEGDSAINQLLVTRDPAKTGGIPLRGVSRNTWDMSPVDVLKNNELADIIAVLGLDINDPNMTDMNYAKVGIFTDADHDGLGHIAPLLMAFFYKFWPKLFEEGKINLVRSPVMISEKRGDTKWFYNLNEAKEFKQQNDGYRHRYIKGIGQLREEEYAKIINDSESLFPIHIDDPSCFDVMFGSDSEKRKEYLLDV